jgi:hypothetical protein
MAELGAIPATQAAVATELAGAAANSRSSFEVAASSSQPHALVDELIRPALGIDAVTVADIARQVPEFSQPLLSW